MKSYYAKRELARQYGKICFAGGIITFNRSTSYKPTIVTYHHIIPVRDGGKISIENGANISSYMHQNLNILEQYFPIDGKQVQEGFIDFKETREDIVREQIHEIIKTKTMSINMWTGVIGDF